MYTFTSVYKKFSIYGNPVDKGVEYEAHFNPNGLVGMFSTADEDLAQKLRNHREFGKKFVELGVKSNLSNINKEVRSSESHPELGKEPIDPKKFIEFGRLQATLLKTDGTYRKDASEEDKLKYEQLKTELEN